MSAKAIFSNFTAICLNLELIHLDITVKKAIFSNFTVICLNLEYNCKKQFEKVMDLT